MFVLGVAAGVGNWLSAPDAYYTIIGGLFVLVIGAHVVGLGFGVEGLRTDPSKTKPLAGTALKALSIVLWAIVIPLAV